MCSEYGIPARRLGADAERAIEAYSWPGNVRELRNQIERIVLLEDQEVVHKDQFHFAAKMMPMIDIF